MGSSFDIAIETVLENEGGLNDTAGDAGGLTNFGLSQRSYPNLDLRNITRGDAIEVYRRDFWLFQGVNSQAVATKLLDSYVNLGHRAIKLAQGLVNAVQDGFWGPATEKLINLEDPALLLSRYRIALVSFYIELVRRKPDQAKYLKGWLRRARS